jgi:hypothetical protein
MSWDKSTYERNEINEKSPARSDKPASGAMSLNDAGDPAGPCDTCGSGQWWQLPGQAWHCRVCTPDVPLIDTLDVARYTFVRDSYQRKPCPVRMLISNLNHGQNV